MKKHFGKLAMVAGISVILTACGGEQKESPATPGTPTTSETPATEPTQTTEPATTETPAVAEISISGGDDMKYDKKEIRVKKGQKVKLTLHHTGKMAKEAMGHNWVLINSSMDIQMFAEAAIKAVATDYVPTSEAKYIIAHTKLIGGGESTTIEFDAPEAGTYKYVCTFPGHWAAMQGVFIVE